MCVPNLEHSDLFSAFLAHVIKPCVLFCIWFPCSL